MTGRPHRAEQLWRERVTLEVEKIRNQQQGRRQDDISRAWKANRISIVEQRGKERQEQDGKMPPLVDIPRRLPGEEGGEGEWPSPSQRKFAKVWRESLAMTNSEKKMEPGGGARKAQLVEVVGMKNVAPPPTWSTWAPIERNVLVEDQQHISNIPYFGDDVIEKDTKFISSIVEEVNTKISASDNLNDDLFLLLVPALALYSPYEEGGPDMAQKYVVLYKPDTKKEKEWASQSMSDPTLPGLIVFQSIATRYPEFGTTDDLIIKYRTLTAQKAKPDFVPNIDGPEAEAIPAHRAIHSYKSLICRRCFLYDCPLHNDSYVEEALPRLQAEHELPLPTRPCSGSDCFLSLPGVLDSLSPRTPRTKDSPSTTFNPQLCEEINPLRAITGTERDVWTGSEITFFRVLAQSFPSNWCAIAQIMITKKCRQVYQFSLEDGETSGNGRVRRSKSQLVKGKKKTTKTNRAAQYKFHSKGGDRENNRIYTPCHHPGQVCSEEVCSCRQSMNFCEKFCYCSADCSHRFQGCKCKSKCTTNLCACFFASRECDPDLCISCQDAGLDLDPETSNCRNMVLQRRCGKKLYVATSDIAGWGCFIGDKALKNEFIAEYVGEMITQEEAERRGKVYDKAKCSYMFNLNEDYCIDAARVGGKIRFANHSSKPNCKSRILLVNGDHRIGIWASRNIDVGEELFFDYGPDSSKLCPDHLSTSEEERKKNRREKRKKVKLKKRQATKYSLRNFEDEERERKECLACRSIQAPPEFNLKCSNCKLKDLKVPVKVTQPKVVLKSLLMTIGDLEKWRDSERITKDHSDDGGMHSDGVGKNAEKEGRNNDKVDRNSDDSVDDLIRSSSDSSSGRSSVEIMSSDNEGPILPPRVWRIKSEPMAETHHTLPLQNGNLLNGDSHDMEDTTLMDASEGSRMNCSDRLTTAPWKNGNEAKEEVSLANLNIEEAHMNDAEKTTNSEDDVEVIAILTNQLTSEVVVDNSKNKLVSDETKILAKSANMIKKENKVPMGISRPPLKTLDEVLDDCKDNVFLSETSAAEYFTSESLLNVSSSVQSLLDRSLHVESKLLGTIELAKVNENDSSPNSSTESSSPDTSDVASKLGDSSRNMLPNQPPVFELDCDNSVNSDNNSNIDSLKLHLSSDNHSKDKTVAPIVYDLSSGSDEGRDIVKDMSTDGENSYAAMRSDHDSDDDFCDENEGCDEPVIEVQDVQTVSDAESVVIESDKEVEEINRSAQEIYLAAPEDETPFPRIISAFSISDPPLPTSPVPRMQLQAELEQGSLRIWKDFPVNDSSNGVEEGMIDVEDNRPPCYPFSRENNESPLGSAIDGSRYENVSGLQRPRRHKCDYCSKTYLKKYALEIHMRNHTGERPYKCNWRECSAEFTSNSALERHYKTHTRVSQFVCDFCNYSTSRADHLQVHMKSHSQSRVNSHEPTHSSNSVETDVIDVEDNQLPRHPLSKEELGHGLMTRHRYKCDHCSKTYFKESALQIHIMRKHNVERPYKCTWQGCQAKFTNNSALDNHYKTHTRVNEYVCDICTYSSSRADHLQAHMKSHPQNRVSSHKPTSSEIWL